MKQFQKSKKFLLSFLNSEMVLQNVSQISRGTIYSYFYQ